MFVSLDVSHSAAPVRFVVVVMGGFGRNKCNA